MQENVRKYLTKLKENRKLRRRNQLVMIAVGLLVVSGVFGMLIMPGLGEETEPVLVCEKAEHTHEDACRGVTCTQEEHEHGDDCKQCTCGKEMHTHSESCGITYTCGKEGSVEIIDNVETPHQHTSECSFDYSCSVEEHEHTDECYNVTCEKTPHTHSEEENCYGYICGQEEHTHSEAAGCYETINANALLTTLSGDSGDADVDEGLVVSLRTEDNEGDAGDTLKVSVRAQSSSPNATGKANIRINIGKLPDGVTLTGLSDSILTEDTGCTIDLELVKNEDGTSYVCFEQSLGETVGFDLIFESKNGIMEELSTLTVQIDTENTKMADGNEGVVVIDEEKSSLSLTWTAENEWDPVDKTVSAEKLAINAENKLSGVITYTIKANSLNKDSFGDIWTKYVTVTDTLTLPEKISLPDGVEVKEGQIVASDGNAILYFTKLQGGSVTSLSIGPDKKTVTYVLEIPNTNKDENEVLTKEMDHLSLEMKMNTSYLVLAENLILEDQSVIEAEKIQNHVKIQPVPYKGAQKPTTEDAVVTIPTLDPEEFEITKTAARTDGTSIGNGVKAGEVIAYTISITNIGETPIAVKNGDTDYTVTDTLPKYMHLTDDQIVALGTAGASVETKVVTDEKTGKETTTYTISWVPSTSKIVKGEKVSLTFNVTIKGDDTDAIKELTNGATIKNSASYKDKKAECPVTYKEADLSVKKTAAVAEGGTTLEDGTTVVKNGGKIEYTLTVDNNTDVDATEAVTITDKLPEGLTFVSAKIGETTVEQSTSNVVLHTASDQHSEEHKVSFTINSEGNELLWNIGKLAANEEIKLTFICMVNTDELESGLKIENIATLSTGKKGSCVIGVDNPINLDKTVKLATEDETAYIDNISKAYPNGTAFDYKIQVSNDAVNPSKKAVELVDQMPVGMLPVDADVPLTQTTTSNESSTITWAKFIELTAENRADNTYKAVFDGYTADVVLVEGAVQFTWSLGEISADSPVTITYRAVLADDTITSGVLKSYTNTATVGDISDAVTVKGGDNSGKLVLNKRVLHSEMVQGNWMWGLSLPTEEKLKEYPIYFVITGIDAQGNAIPLTDNDTKLIVPYSNFKQTIGSDKAPQYSFEITGLPAGTYTITEMNYDYEDGYNCEPIFDTGSGSAKTITQVDESTVEISVINNGTSIIDVENLYYKADTINLQKSVYEIAKYDENTKAWQSLADKSRFYIDEGDDTYVVYNILASVSEGVPIGGRYITVSLTDQLPEELSYVGIYYPNRGYTNGAPAYKLSDFTNTAEMQSFYINTWSADNSNLTWATGTRISATYDDASNMVSFDLKFPDYKYSNGNVGETFETNEFPSSYVVSFLMLCKVNDGIEEGQEITNTLQMEVEDRVNYAEKSRYKTYRTPSDNNQNNGETVLVSGGDAAGNEKTILTSSVTIVPENTIVPGIEKEAVSYILQGSQTENSLEEESSIVPNSAVKWEITIHNDGTESMKDYEVKDSVTSPFHFMTAEEAEEFGISTIYKYEVRTFDGVWHKTFDITEDVLKTITNGSEISEYTFDFSDQEYSIPAGGSAVLTMYTNNTIGSYKAYKNTATVYPKDDFSANLVKYGELIKDSTGKYVGVTASDSVYAFGEFATVSWKTITEVNDSTNTAKGTDSKNYIVVDSDSREVVYTNNIKNSSKNIFTDMVVIDVMPMKNDMGVVNQHEKRGSEFRVPYTGNMTAKILDSSGNTLSEPAFTVEFSEAASFTEKDFAGAQTSKWHDEWTDNDRSFRVKFSDSFVIKSGETLVIQYEGVVEEAAVPGAIAWNSFGYQYKCGTESLRAEPPKVGVMIPEVPIIQKEVVDSNGDIQEKDAEKEFTFILWDKELYDPNATEAVNKTTAKLCEFTIPQGGYLELTSLNYELEEGKEYMITEDTTNMPEEYSLVGIGEYGGELSESYSFVYDKTKSINILARNSVEKYVKELPETGSFDALAFKVIGILLVLSAGILGGYRLIIRRKKRNLL